MTIRPGFPPFSLKQIETKKSCATKAFWGKELTLSTNTRIVDKALKDCTDIDTLLQLAKWHTETARKIKLQAAELIKGRERQAQYQRDRDRWSTEKSQLIRLMVAQMRDGKNFSQAVRFGSKTSGKDEKTCETLLKRFVRQQKKQAREVRKLLVIRHAQAGWTNDEIARELGCHRNTVSKDLSEIINGKIDRF